MPATKTPRNSGIQAKARSGRSRGKHGHGQDYSLRNSDEPDQGGDSISGGSPQELGLVGVYPSHLCQFDINPPFNAHHYIEIVHNVFCCKYCYMPLYQPHIYTDAKRFGEEIRRQGKDKAYTTRVGKNPRVRKSLEILMAVHIARRGLSREEVETAIRMVKEHYKTQDDPELFDVGSGRWWNE